MNFSDIIGLGSIAVNLFSSLSKRNIYRSQQNDYEAQAEINQRIGAFNAQVAEMTGTQSVYLVAEQSRKLLGRQINTLTAKGISLTGSPLFVLGETKTMGERGVQEAYFNAQVTKTNHEYAALSATQAARARAEEAKYGQYGAMLDTVKSVYNGANLLKSMFKSSPLNTTMRSTPIPFMTNSTIGNLRGTMFI